MKNFCHFIVLRFFYIKNITISGLIFFIYYSINIIRGRIFCYGSSITVINRSSFSRNRFGCLVNPVCCLDQVNTKLCTSTNNHRKINQKNSKEKDGQEAQILSHSSAIFFWIFTILNGKAYDSFFPGFHILLLRSNIFIIQLQVL